MSITTPRMENARCLGCGYSLYGLPANVCPECGRAFDPLDVTTFDSRTPATRRRKWIVRGIVVACLGLVYFAVGPRRLAIGHIHLACKTCTQSVTTYRFEPIPPTWIPGRYPAFRWTTRTPPVVSDGGACASHVFNDVRVKFDMFAGGFAFAHRYPLVPEAQTMNGQLLVPETSHDVLRHLMSPYNRGLGP